MSDDVPPDARLQDDAPQDTAAQDDAALARGRNLQRLIDRALDYAVIVTDADARIQMWSPGAEAVLGWSADEALGQAMDLIFTPEDRAAGAPAHERAHASAFGSAIDERWHLRADGQRFWGSGTTVSLGEGGRRGFAKILRDGTRRKEAEDALHRLNETLEARVEARTAELGRLNDALAAEIAERVRAEEDREHLSRALLMAERTERRRIALVLHDDLQQVLFGLRLKLNLLARAVEDTGRDELRASTAELGTWLGYGIDITRQLVVDLSPPMLWGEGLAQALHWLARQMHDLHGLAVEVRAAPDAAHAAEDARALAFQMVRDVLFSARKQTTAATVDVREDGPALVVRVEHGSAGAALERPGEPAPEAVGTNGVGATGFAVATGSHGSGDGRAVAGTGAALSNIEERVRLAGGLFHVREAAAGGATVVECRIPLRPLTP